MKGITRCLCVAAMLLGLASDFIKSGADTENPGPPPPCLPGAPVITMEGMSDMLMEKYGERKIWTGSMAGRAFWSLYRHGESGWTITMTFPNGITCLVAFGQESVILPLD